MFSARVCVVSVYPLEEEEEEEEEEGWHVNGVGRARAKPGCPRGKKKGRAKGEGVVGRHFRHIIFSHGTEVLERTGLFFIALTQQTLYMGEFAGKRRLSLL